ncbi:hypothetical protein L1987_09143 [Smallanthus sonchifolius]|uniref:Uncharacterized protein n=1 Tax=Smallanthus sonchifolius TaxID=185202 RepID=A0ACB9JP39_9ASTR|nr:hypothetical protein L1987_09143 [Smallanthus sonchifolius]
MSCLAKDVVLDEFGNPLIQDYDLSHERQKKNEFIAPENHILTSERENVKSVQIKISTPTKNQNGCGRSNQMNVKGKSNDVKDKFIDVKDKPVQSKGNLSDSDSSYVSACSTNSMCDVSDYEFGNQLIPDYDLSHERQKKNEFIAPENHILTSERENVKSVQIKISTPTKSQNVCGRSNQMNIKGKSNDVKDKYIDVKDKPVQSKGKLVISQSSIECEKGKSVFEVGECSKSKSKFKRYNKRTKGNINKWFKKATKNDSVFESGANHRYSLLKDNMYFKEYLNKKDMLIKDLTDKLIAAQYDLIKERVLISNCGMQRKMLENCVDKQRSCFTKDGVGYKAVPHPDNFESFPKPQVSNYLLRDDNSNFHDLYISAANNTGHVDEKVLVDDISSFNEFNKVCVRETIRGCRQFVVDTCIVNKFIESCANNVVDVNSLSDLIVHMFLLVLLTLCVMFLIRPKKNEFKAPENHILTSERENVKSVQIKISTLAKSQNVCGRSNQMNVKGKSNDVKDKPVQSKGKPVTNQSSIECDKGKSVFEVGECSKSKSKSKTKSKFKNGVGYKAVPHPDHFESFPKPHVSNDLLRDDNSNFHDLYISAANNTGHVDEKVLVDDMRSFKEFNKVCVREIIRDCRQFVVDTCIVNKFIDSCANNVVDVNSLSDSDSSYVSACSTNSVYDVSDSKDVVLDEFGIPFIQDYDLSHERPKKNEFIAPENHFLTSERENLKSVQIKISTPTKSQNVCGRSNQMNVKRKSNDVKDKFIDVKDKPVQSKGKPVISQSSIECDKGKSVFEVGECSKSKSKTKSKFKKYLNKKNMLIKDLTDKLIAAQSDLIKERVMIYKCGMHRKMLENCVYKKRSCFIKDGVGYKAVPHPDHFESFPKPHVSNDLLRDDNSNFHDLYISAANNTGHVDEKVLVDDMRSFNEFNKVCVRETIRDCRQFVVDTCIVNKFIKSCANNVIDVNSLSDSDSSYVSSCSTNSMCDVSDSKDVVLDEFGNLLIQDFDLSHERQKKNEFMAPENHILTSERENVKSVQIKISTQTKSQNVCGRSNQMNVKGKSNDVKDKFIDVKDKPVQSKGKSVISQSSIECEKIKSVFEVGECSKSKSKTKSKFKSQNCFTYGQVGHFRLEL